jgi:uncharacterized glyoxalase superfamily protein PhnB
MRVERITNPVNGNASPAQSACALQRNSTFRETNMQLVNRSMPQSVIIPVLGYTDVRKAVEWLCRSFGFVERLQIGDHRSQLSFGEGAVVVTGQGAEPVALHGQSVMIRLPAVDGHYKHAQQCGVNIISPPSDFPYGERQYTAADLENHIWTFSQTIADIDPADWGGVLFER